MDVHITRDCQIDGVFYEKGNQLSIEASNFNADCMSPIVPQTIVQDTDPPEEIPKPPKKHKK